ncbi:MAG: type II toxin-antitoxin system PemK/MazF family toxin [Chloroflexi bacterium]|nr:type II toxin-antitoxin system PemK/MazF family toxin [Chloroflexota bacterium]
MVVKRGEIWWAVLPEPAGSVPGYHRPVVIIQSDAFNRSRVNTVLAVVVTSNLRLAPAPGNVYLSAKSTGLSKDSVANVSQVVTVDRAFLTERIGQLTSGQIQQIEEGLRLVLAL